MCNSLHETVRMRIMRWLPTTHSTIWARTTPKNLWLYIYFPMFPTLLLSIASHRPPPFPNWTSYVQVENTGVRKEASKHENIAWKNLRTNNIKETFKHELVFEHFCLSYARFSLAMAVVCQLKIKNMNKWFIVLSVVFIYFSLICQTEILATMVSNWHKQQ